MPAPIQRQEAVDASFIQLPRHRFLMARVCVRGVPIRASRANLWRTSGGRNGNKDGITSGHKSPHPAAASPPHLQVPREITLVASETYFKTIAQSPRFVHLRNAACCVGHLLS